MGFLFQGHVTISRRKRFECDSVTLRHILFERVNTSRFGGNFFRGHGENPD